MFFKVKSNEGWFLNELKVNDVVLYYHGSGSQNTNLNTIKTFIIAIHYIDIILYIVSIAFNGSLV